MSNTNFPGAIDTGPANPSTSDTLASNPHHTQHGFENDAVIAVETKLGNGTGSQTPVANSFLMGYGAGTSKWFASPTSPSFTTSLLDSNNNTWIGQTPIGSAVDYVNIANAATGGTPAISVLGTDSNISLNLVPKGSGKVQDNGSNLVDFRSSFSNFIQSGGIWSQNSGLIGSMTVATIWINGVEYSVAAVNNHTFAASSDTYVDYTVGTGVTYNAQANNAASPSLAANSVRIAIVVTSGAAITFINQGQLDTTLTNFGPTVSSNALTVSDSLGNRIYPTNPSGGILGYRQITTSFTTATQPGYVAVTGLSMPWVSPGNRDVLVTVYCGSLKTSGSAGNGVNLAALESSTVLGSQAGSFAEPVTNYPAVITVPVPLHAPSAGAHTYVANASQSAAGTLSVGAGTGAAGTSGPAYIMVELK